MITTTTKRFNPSYIGAQMENLYHFKVTSRTSGGEYITRLFTKSGSEMFNDVGHTGVLAGYRLANKWNNQAHMPKALDTIHVYTFEGLM